MSGRPRDAVCPACGEAFSCGVDLGDCWCGQAELGADTLRELAAGYRDCLCPRCLASRRDSADYSGGRRPGTSRLGSSGVSPGA